MVCKYVSNFKKTHSTANWNTEYPHLSIIFDGKAHMFEVTRMRDAAEVLSVLLPVFCVVHESMIGYYTYTDDEWERRKNDNPDSIYDDFLFYLSKSFPDTIKYIKTESRADFTPMAKVVEEINMKGRIE